MSRAWVWCGAALLVVSGLVTVALVRAVVSSL